LMLFLFSRPGLICAIFPKKIYPSNSFSVYACFPVLFILGTIASKNARTSVRLYLAPPASAGGVYYLVITFSHPVPSVRERKGSNFFLPSNFSAKKKFLFFSPINPSQNVAIPSKRVQI